MTFGEKLKALRREKGYSQEELADLLNVSRQAVSKWESDRGLPEIDNILQISNMFGVTLDYLLKSENPDENSQNNGYYVNREMIDSFLSYKKQRAKKVAIGIGLIISANIFGCFSDYRQVLLPLYWGTMAIGIAVLVWIFLQPKRYQEICSKPLIFDEAEIKAFREESDQNRKRYVAMIILGVLLFFLAPELSSIVKDIVGSEMRNAVNWVMNTASVMFFIIAGTSIHAENIITQNTEYITKKTSRS